MLLSSSFAISLVDNKLDTLETGTFAMNVSVWVVHSVEKLLDAHLVIGTGRRTTKMVAPQALTS